VLQLGLTLMLFASIHLVFSPLSGTAVVSQGDFLRLLAYSVLLVGVWRAIRSSEFRRAVAEERARVAREIHDGLAQYLFAVTTHVSMLETGADREQTLPRLKEAALAAQQEARFAVLALSSAAGSAPFDAALRRYVHFLTADGDDERRARARVRTRAGNCARGRLALLTRDDRRQDQQRSARLQLRQHRRVEVGEGERVDRVALDVVDLIRARRRCERQRLVE